MVKEKGIFWQIIIVIAVLMVLFFNSSEADNSITKNIIAEEAVFEDYVDKFSASIDTHWNHMPLTYNWNDECNEWRNGNYTQRIKIALNEISNVTDSIVTFSKSDSEEPDIMFLCNKSLFYEKDRILAEAENSYYEETNTYGPSRIYIYNSNECKGRPTTLIHEILHILGVPHSQGIMLPIKHDCNVQIHDSTIEYLKKTYTNQEGYFDWNIQKWLNYYPYNFPSLSSCDGRNIENSDKYNCVFYFAKDNPEICEKEFNVNSEKYWISKCYYEMAMIISNPNLCDIIRVYDVSQTISTSPYWKCKTHFGLLSECEEGCIEEEINYNAKKCILECEKGGYLR